MGYVLGLELEIIAELELGGAAHGLLRGTWQMQLEYSSELQ